VLKIRFRADFQLGSLDKAPMALYLRSFAKSKTAKQNALAFC
jgi:hypothetical protein